MDRSATGLHLVTATQVDRAARIGVLVSVLVAATVAGWSIDPPHGTAVTHPVGLLLTAIAVVPLSLAVLVLVRSRHRLRVPASGLFAAWSACCVALIGLAVTFGGGSRSPLLVLYALPVVFFGSVFRLRHQWLVIAMTLTSVTVALAVAPGPIHLERVTFALLIIVTTGILASFLSGLMRQQVDAHLAASQESERREQLLASVAIAGRSVLYLDHVQLFEGLVSSMRLLGFTAAALFVRDADGTTYSCQAGTGLPETVAARGCPIHRGLAGEVFADGRTHVVEDYRTYPNAVTPIREAGYRAAVATPVLSEQGVEAVLVVLSKTRSAIERYEVEALELMAVAAGLALGNARRFEAEARARRELEHLERLQEDFIATASHELRTPTTVLRGVTEILVSSWDALDEVDRRRLVERAQAHASQLVATVTQLDTFTGANRDRQRPCASFSLYDIFDLVRRGTRWGHDVEWQLPRPVTVRARPGALERVLTELVTNAIKHCPPGTRIAVSAHSHDGTVTIAVRDDGPGLPDGLTAPFRRGGDVLTRPTRGLGLGLAMVQQVLADHDSHLHVEAPPGGGTRTWFTLPVIEPAEANARAPESSAPGPGRVAGDVAARADGARTTTNHHG